MAAPGASSAQPSPREALPALCPNCGYDATGLVFESRIATCPECGKKIDEAWARTVGEFRPSGLWGVVVPSGCLLLAIGSMLVPFRYKPEYVVAGLLSLVALLPVVTAWRASRYRLEGHKPSMARRIVQASVYVLVIGVVLGGLGALGMFVLAVGVLSNSKFD